MTFKELVKQVIKDAGAWYDFDMVRNAVKDVKPDFYYKSKFFINTNGDAAISLLYIVDDVALSIDFDSIANDFTVYCEVFDHMVDARFLGVKDIREMDAYDKKIVNTFNNGGVQI